MLWRLGIDRVQLAAELRNVARQCAGVLVGGIELRACRAPTHPPGGPAQCRTAGRDFGNQAIRKAQQFVQIARGDDLPGPEAELVIPVRNVAADADRRLAQVQRRHVAQHGRGGVGQRDRRQNRGRSPRIDGMSQNRALALEPRTRFGLVRGSSASALAMRWPRNPLQRKRSITPIHNGAATTNSAA